MFSVARSLDSLANIFFPGKQKSKYTPKHVLGEVNTSGESEGVPGTYLRNFFVEEPALSTSAFANLRQESAGSPSKTPALNEPLLLSARSVLIPGGHKMSIVSCYLMLIHFRPKQRTESPQSKAFIQFKAISSQVLQACYFFQVCINLTFCYPAAFLQRSFTDKQPLSGLKQQQNQSSSAHEVTSLKKGEMRLAILLSDLAQKT